MRFNRGTHLETFDFIGWLWAGTLVLVPLLYVFNLSLLNRGIYGGVEGPLTGSNFQRLLSLGWDSPFVISLIRSVGLSLFTTFLCIIAAFPFALFLVFGVRTKIRNVLLFLLIIPFWTNFLIRTYAWMVVLSDNGWLNLLLSKLGFGEQATHFLFTPTAIYLGMVYNYLPYMAMCLFISIEKLDVSQLEAAADLGANVWVRFYKIILRQSIPGLVSGSILVFVPCLGEFVIPDVLGGGTRLYLGNLLTQQFLTVRDWPMGATMTVALIALMLIALFFANKATQGRIEEYLA